MTENEQNSLSRRQFLATLSAATAGASLASCQSSGHTNAIERMTAVAEPTTRQQAGKRKGPSPVAIVACDSYDKDIAALIKPYLANLDLPDLAGKRVVVKPNMVDVVPGFPITTAPQVVRAAVELAKWQGAREIVIAEGSGHNRDMEYLLEATGIGRLCKELDVPFINLNLDDIEPLDLEEPFSGIKPFWLPKTIASCDALVSVPKLKTHHWVQMTCAMKNLFGCLPGRKYGWPKNILHWRGIPNCILDLNRLLRPAFAVVDGIIGMEGDGPLNGTAKHANIIVVGSDVAAVDATCARAIGMNPDTLPYLRRAGQVIGNIDEVSIKLVGKDLHKVCTAFELPPDFKPGGEKLLTLSDDLSGGS